MPAPGSGVREDLDDSSLARGRAARGEARSPRSWRWPRLDRQCPPIPATGSHSGSLRMVSDAPREASLQELRVVHGRRRTEADRERDGLRGRSGHPSGGVHASPSVATRRWSQRSCVGPRASNKDTARARWQLRVSFRAPRTRSRRHIEHELDAPAASLPCRALPRRSGCSRASGPGRAAGLFRFDHLPANRSALGLARIIHHTVGCGRRIAGISGRTAGSRSSRTSVRSSLRFRACAPICLALLGLAGRCGE